MSVLWKQDTPITDTGVLKEIGHKLVTSKLQHLYPKNDVKVPTLMDVPKATDTMSMQPSDVLLTYIREWVLKEGPLATLGKLLSIFKEAEYGGLVNCIQQLISDDDNEQTEINPTTSPSVVVVQNDTSERRPTGREELQILTDTASPRENLPNRNPDSPSPDNVQSFENSINTCTIHTKRRLTFGSILVLIGCALVLCIGAPAILATQKSGRSSSTLPSVEPSSVEQSRSNNISLASIMVHDTMHGNITSVSVTNYPEYKRTMEQLCDRIVGPIILTISLRLATDWPASVKYFCSEHVTSLSVQGIIYLNSLIDIMQSTYRSTTVCLKLDSDPITLDYNRSLANDKLKLHVQDIIIECQNCKEVFNIIIECFEFPALNNVVVEQQKISDLEMAMKRLYSTKISSLKLSASSENLHSLLVSKSRFVLKSLVSLELNFIGKPLLTPQDNYEMSHSLCALFPNLVCLNSTGWRFSFQSLAYCENLKCLKISTLEAEMQTITNLAYFDEKLPFLEFLYINFWYSNSTFCPENGLTGWNHLRNKNTLEYRVRSNCTIKFDPMATNEVFRNQPQNTKSDLCHSLNRQLNKTFGIML